MRDSLNGLSTLGLQMRPGEFLGSSVLNVQRKAFQTSTPLQSSTLFGTRSIQIAAMRFSSGCLSPEETFASFAKPRRPISAFIESYTKIGNRHVQRAKRPEEVLCEFAACQR